MTAMTATEMWATRVPVDACHTVHLEKEGASLSVTSACLSFCADETCKVPPQLSLSVATRWTGAASPPRDARDLPKSAHRLATFRPGRTSRTNLDLSFFPADSHVTFVVSSVDGSRLPEGAAVDIIGVLERRRPLQPRPAAAPATATAVAPALKSPVTMQEEDDTSGETDESEEEATSAEEAQACPPGFEIFEIMLPPEARPGDRIEVEAPNGRTIGLTVPNGASGGDVVPVKLPVEDPQAVSEDEEELRGLDEYGLRVMNMYLKYNPDKLRPGFVQGLMTKVRGKEENLLKKLVDMYGPEESDDDDNMDFAEADDETEASKEASEEAEAASVETAETAERAERAESAESAETGQGNTVKRTTAPQKKKVVSAKKKGKIRAGAEPDEQEKGEEEFVPPRAVVGKRVALRSGVEYMATSAGADAADADGPPRVLRKAEVVTVRYKGVLAASGKKFGSGSLTVVAGCGQVVPGLDEGMVGMREGEKRRIFVPAIRGYGGAGQPPAIPPNSDLIFDVELRRVGSRRSEERERTQRLRKLARTRRGQRAADAAGEKEEAATKTRKLGRRAKRRMREAEQRRKDRTAGKRARREKRKKGERVKGRPLSEKERAAAREKRRAARLAESTASASAASDALASDFALKMVNARTLASADSLKK